MWWFHPWYLGKLVKVAGSKGRKKAGVGPAWRVRNTRGSSSPGPTPNLAGKPIVGACPTQEAVADRFPAI
jgi:hypothetical protein